MDIKNLLPKPFFIGSVGTTKFNRGERPRLGQGIRLAANGEPGDTLMDIPDWLYHSDPELRQQELAGRIMITFSGARTSGVVQPEIDAIVVGLGGALTMPLQEQSHLTKEITFQTAATTTIDFDRLAVNNARLVWDSVATPTGPESSEVRLYNVTDATLIVGLTGIQSTGPRSILIVAFPTGVKTIALQHRVTGGSDSSEITGGSLQTGTT